MPTDDDRAAVLAAMVREQLPTCAAVAAEFQKVFGEVTMAYACENGHTLGKRGPDGIPMSETLVSGSLSIRKGKA